MCGRINVGSRIECPELLRRIGVETFRNLGCIQRLARSEAGHRRRFAPDVTQQAEFEAHSQALTAATVFTTPDTQPAWKTKPSWYAVAKADRIINPDLERMYAKRAHSHTIEVEGASHSIYESHPKEVAALIEDAARHALEGK